MANNRVFFPQEAFDLWLEEGKISLDADVLTLQPEGQRFNVTSALRFTAEVADGEDEAGLVGKVKSLEQVAELGGEHCADSVVLGNNAYEVIEGFLGEPIEGEQTSGTSVSSATRAAVGENADDSTGALARFLMQG